jgi:hypothetical protein
MKNPKTNTSLTATEAREFTKEIAIKCSECFPEDKIRARKFLGSGACYGKTVKSAEATEDLIRVFTN